MNFGASEFSVPANERGNHQASERSGAGGRSEQCRASICQSFFEQTSERMNDSLVFAVNSLNVV